MQEWHVKYLLQCCFSICSINGSRELQMRGWLWLLGGNFVTRRVTRIPCEAQWLSDGSKVQPKASSFYIRHLLPELRRVGLWVNKGVFLSSIEGWKSLRECSKRRTLLTKLGLHSARYLYFRLKTFGFSWRWRCVRIESWANKVVVPTLRRVTFLRVLWSVELRQEFCVLDRVINIPSSTVGFSYRLDTASSSCLSLEFLLKLLLSIMITSSVNELMIFLFGLIPMTFVHKNGLLYRDKCPI